MTTAAAAARIGLFGGTFNPIHVGHLRAAEEVREILGLERMVFVPAALPPHKPARAGDAIAPAEARLGWVRDATRGNPRFEVDPLELGRAGPSYSVDTLRAWSARTSPGSCVFVIGHDAFADLGTWREPRELLRLAHFAVTTRPPSSEGSLARWLPPSLADEVVLAPDGRSGVHKSAGTWIRALEITALDVSASDLRARLRSGRSVRYLLPDAIHDDVVASGFYAPAETP
jgi:nicotinate-nucleotide adenylyltransferase